MSVDKKVKYKVQGGVKNYLPSEMVTVPKKAKSSPKHPATELAYITKAEKNLLIKKNLHGSLKGKVNKGPGGIISLNGGFNEPGGFQSGGNQSAAESGDKGAFGGGRENEARASAVRAAAINAGAGQRVNPGFFDSKNVISPAEVAMAKAYRNDPTNTFAKGAYKNTRGGAFGNFISGGGITGGIIRGLGQALGFGKKYNEPTYNMDPNKFANNFENEYGYTTDYQGEKPMGFLTSDDKDNNDGNRDGDNQQGIYTIYPQAAKALESPKELLDFIQRFRVKEPYSQIKGSDYVQEAKDIAETMKNFYT